MRIAAFLPNWIGDVAMATPAIAALQARYTDARITAVGRPYVEGVVAGSPWLADFVPLDRTLKSALSAAKRLRRDRTGAAVLFPNSFRPAAIAALAGCRRRIGFARYGRGFLLTDRFKPLRDRAGMYTPTPILRDYNRLAAALGARPSDRLELETIRDDDCRADAVLKGFSIRPSDTLVALNPGAAFGASKFWPTDSFAELGRRFADERGAKILVLCGPGERNTAREIAAKSGRKSVYSVADAALSIGLTKALVRRADLLVTTDSGPRHFAAAFDRPVVTIFGPTHIGWTETFFEKAIHLQKQVPCGPCQLRACPLDHRCMKEMTVGEVFAAGTSLLDRFGRGGLRRAG